MKIDKIETIIYDYLKSIDSIKVKVGNLIHGLIYVCQLKILVNQDIVKLLADVVQTVSWEVFSAILPALRKSFSELGSNEYEIFVEKLAEYYGLKKKKQVFFKSVDAKLRKLFEEWFGEV